MHNIISRAKDDKTFSTEDIDRIIEMAWEDRTPFDAITFQFNIKEQEVIDIMRRELKQSSFKLWRARVQGRKTKHQSKRNFENAGRFKCTRQKQITHNKISKR
ncbi:TIGR03643 family protein [Pontimicrobium sp. MEBiC01747]